MQYLLDVGFLAVFALTVYISAKRGFFASLIDLGAYVISLIAAKLFSQQFAPQMYAATLEGPLREQVAASLGKVGVTDYAAQIKATLRSLPESVSGVMDLIGIDRNQLLKELSSGPLAGKNMVNNIMESVVSPVGTAVVRTLMFLVIAVVLSVVLRVVCTLLNGAIQKLPAIKQINTGLGVVLGVLRGALVVLLVALLLGVVAGVTDNKDFISLVKDSMIEKAVGGFLTSISGYVINP